MMSNEELLNIEGGAFRWSVSFFTWTLKAVSALSDLGTKVGSAWRRYVSHSTCKV